MAKKTTLPPKRGTKRGTKRALEDEVFASEPILKQKRFTPRLKAIKADALGSSPMDRSRKRPKNQTTMTQLDFGKRSYLEAICDSDGEDEDEDEDGDVKSEDDMDDEVTPKPKSTSSRKKEGNQRRTGRKSRLPAKTESQDTLTQMVKRSSDVSFMVIDDSEDEAGILDEEVSDAEVDETEVVAEERLIHTGRDGQSQGQEMNHDAERRETEPRRETSIMEPVAEPEDPAPGPIPPKTPKRVRVLPVPSSKSPPDTHLSTQVTPRHDPAADLKSPLQERSVNIPAFQRSPSKPTQSSPLKHQLVQEHVLGDENEFQVSPLRRQQFITDEQDKSSPRKPSPVKKVLASAGKQATQCKEGSQTQTRRRVREFNARFAALERETFEMRRRRSALPGNADMPVAASRRSPRRKANAAMETQYTMPGVDTQNALMELPFPATSEEQREESPEIVECSQVMDDDVDGETHDDVPVFVDGTNEKKAGSEAVVREEILIPSSQSRKSRRMIVSSQADEDESPEVDANGLFEESLPESPYPAASARSKKDTQELASDQLMRETQQAFLYRVPSSPLITKPASTRPSQRQSQPAPRPSQATTVDETMTYSSYQHIPTQPSQRKFPRVTGVLDLTSSSPRLETTPIILQPIPSSSSPLHQPPDFGDALGHAASSSSPRLPPEPKTPSILRNLKRPLRREDLVGEESLDASLSMRMPPSWGFGEEVEVDSDDEL